MATRTERRSRRTAGFALAWLAACSGSPVPAPRLHPVTIRGMTFEPAELEVRVGDSIEWVNRDVVPHTVTAPTRFDSQVIAPAATWRYKVMVAGRFDYVCTLHPTMTGALVAR